MATNATVIDGGLKCSVKWSKGIEMKESDDMGGDVWKIALIGASGGE